MNPATMPLLMIGLFVILIVSLVWATARQGQLAANNVRQLAGTLGLEFVAGTPALGMFYPEARASGQWRGRRTEIFPFSTGSGKSRVSWSAFSVAPRADRGLTFDLRPQGFGTKMMELFGSREIQVGDAEFDRTWFIQTNQPDFFRAALVPEIREKIMALARESGWRNGQLRLEQGVVRYAEQGSFADAALCDRIGRAAEVIGDLADLAEVFAAQK